MRIDPSGLCISSQPALARISTAKALVLAIILSLGSGVEAAKGQLGLAGFSLIDDSERGQMGRAVAAGDFDGDGFDDLAIGIPNHSSSSFGDAGIVLVYSGREGGWSPMLQFLSPTFFSPSGAEDGSRFGAVLAVGDFDNDGYDDLAIGVPQRTVNGATNAGEIIVVYGSPEHLDQARAQAFSQVALPGIPEAGDLFGSTLAAGDLSADGVDDLAIGIPNEDIDMQLDVGAVNVLYGVLDVGLTTSGSQLIHQDTPGVGLNGNDDELFGFSLVIGQFTGNSIPDLAVGTPGEIVLGPGEKGAVVIFPGAAGGLDPVAGIEIYLSQESPDILGTAQVGDQFGYSLAKGNFDGDMWTDLAIGVPGESELGATQSGAVQVLYGGPIGLAAFGNQFLVESSFDTEVDPFDRLGTSLQAGDFDGDGRDDLAIGAPLDNSLGVIDAGEVDVLYGTPIGLTIAGGQVFDMIFFDTLEVHDHFGAALAAGRFFSNSSDSQDLVIGIPFRGEPAGDDPGAVLVIRSQSLFSDGFETGDTSSWNQP